MLLVESAKESALNKRLKRWLPLFVWVFLIFAFSSIPQLSGNDVPIPEGFDKVAHFIEYAVLAVFFYRGLSYDSEKNKWFICIFIVVFGSGIAALDEFYQSYIPGRFSSSMDLLADIAGVGVGALLAVARHIRADKKVEHI